MELIKIIDLMAVFLVGFLVASLIGLYLISGYEITYIPFLNNISINDNFSEAPSDYIDERQIEVYEDRIIINVDNAGISRYASTGSMIPILDENSNGIRIIPESENDIMVGDIIVFSENFELIVHRVIEKGVDEDGVYFITKGDNNFINDGKVRFEDIEYKTIGVIW